jgi:hypothetical protein
MPRCCPVAVALLLLAGLGWRTGAFAQSQSNDDEGSAEVETRRVDVPCNGGYRGVWAKRMRVLSAPRRTALRAPLHHPSTCSRRDVFLCIVHGAVQRGVTTLCGRVAGRRWFGAWLGSTPPPWLGRVPSVPRSARHDAFFRTAYEPIMEHTREWRPKVVRGRRNENPPSWASPARESP